MRLKGRPCGNENTRPCLPKQPGASSANPAACSDPGGCVGGLDSEDLTQRGSLRMLALTPCQRPQESEASSVAGFRSPETVSRAKIVATEFRNNFCIKNYF